MAKMMKKAADGYTNYGSKAGKPSPVTDYAGKAGKQDSYTQYKKGGVIKKKAEKGKSFPDLNKDGKITKADILKGRGVIAKKGAKMKMGGAMAKQAAIAIAMKKAGKTPKKKMQYGGEAASMVPTMKKGGMKKKYKSGGTVSMQLGSYDKQIGKNYTGKAKMGKSMGKCKNGC